MKTKVYQEIPGWLRINYIHRQWFPRLEDTPEDTPSESDFQELKEERNVFAVVSLILFVLIMLLT